MIDVAGARGDLELGEPDAPDGCDVALRGRCADRCWTGARNCRPQVKVVFEIAQLVQSALMWSAFEDVLGAPGIPRARPGCIG